jgi:hypothetical protein
MLVLRRKARKILEFFFFYWACNDATFTRLVCGNWPYLGKLLSLSFRLSTERPHGISNLQFPVAYAFCDFHAWCGAETELSIMAGRSHFFLWLIDCSVEQ